MGLKGLYYLAAKRAIQGFGQQPFKLAALETVLGTLVHESPAIFYYAKEAARLLG